MIAWCLQSTKAMKGKRRLRRSSLLRTFSFGRRHSLLRFELWARHLRQSRLNVFTDCFVFIYLTKPWKQSKVMFFQADCFSFICQMKHWKSDFQSFSRRNPFAILKMAETLQMFYYQLCANNVWSFFYIYKVPLRCLTPKKKRKYK